MAVLSVYLVLLVCIESRLVIGPLGAVGSPALLVGCACFGWWCWHQAQRPATGWGRQPVRVALLGLFLAFVASYASAMARPISAQEVATAQIGLVMVLGSLGVALVTHDGVDSPAGFERVVRLMVWLGAGLAALGLAQFLVEDAIVRSFTIPGLVPNAPLAGLTERSGFTRPFGTALHPIEFGAVITTLLPLAVARARAAARPSWLHWAPVGLMGLAVMLSISRSALVCAVAVLVVMVPGLDRRTRALVVAGTAGTGALVAVTVPGMLGSLTALFVTAGQDGSVQSRTGSYPMAFEMLGSAPLFGRGYSTFLPMYRIFDNQYLLLLVEVGLVGLAAFLAVVVVAFGAALRARSVTATPAVREYGLGLMAAVASGALGLAFFDGFSFPMSTGVLFVVLGLAGALRRVALREPTPNTPARRGATVADSDAELP